MSTQTDDGVTLPPAAVGCRHCGEPCDRSAVVSPQGTFCCFGCDTVFSLLQAHGLDGFYAGGVAPGPSQRHLDRLDDGRFAALDDAAASAHVVEFDDGRIARAIFRIPALHCASCVWLLEQFWRFDPGTTRTEVDLQRRTLRVEYRPDQTSARRIAAQLAALGYEPDLSPERDGTPPLARRRLYLQIGVAGFAVGNIMLFSIPRYLNGAPLEPEFQRLFGGLNIALSIPVLLFSASDYFRTAWAALRHRTMALEVPVALGLAVLFVRSTAEIVSGRGEGFLDSFVGLVFFLLIGRLFQQRVFDTIAFDRTYRSFLPLSVTVERDGVLAAVPIDRLRPGDCIHLRRREVVPADASLLDANGAIDYHFVSGEQTPVIVRHGGAIRAGGRAVTAMRVCVRREVSQSQLAGLWAHPGLTRSKSRWLSAVTATFGGWFTLAATALAIAGAIAWWPDAAASASVATAVLIVACPCALTLAAPIALGTAMGQLGRRGLYLRDAAVALDLSRVDTVVFDKTGTLTPAGAEAVIEKHGLSDRAWALARRLAMESRHPVSRAIAEGSAVPSLPRPRHLRETPGQGLSAIVDGQAVAIGTAAFIARCTGRPVTGDDRTHVVSAGEQGWVCVSVAARAGVEQAARTLAAVTELCLLSGDHDGERRRWSSVFGERMRFRQSPEDKLAFVAETRASGRRVLMVGDGLNDAGALAAADVGLAVTDDTACIVPRCDGLIGGDHLVRLPAFLRFARLTRTVIVICFVVSLAYNVIGLSLALSGALTPLASAILMPVSSITIAGLGTGLVRWAARRVLPA